MTPEQAARSGLDEDLRRLLAHLESVGSPPLHAVDPARARRGHAALARSLARVSPPVDVADRMLPIGRGRSVPVRVYRPLANADQPVVVYLHGGGWVVGDLDTHDSLARDLATTADAVVVSVDYRLAPEHPFPAAVEDASAALASVLRDPACFGAQRQVVGVLGDSAGANLAVSSTLNVGSAEGETPAMLLLFYPLLHHVARTESRRRLARGYMLESATLDWFSQHYAAGASAASLDSHPLANPTVADLRGLPPTRLVLAEFDPLVDEGRELAKALEDAGVEVALRTEPGMLHGFLELGGWSRAAHDAARRELRTFGRYLRSCPS